MTVTGILSSSNGNLRLLPRGTEDVQTLSAAIVDDAEVTGALGQTEQQNRMAETVLFITLAVLIGLALRSLIPQITKAYASRRSVRVRAEATN